MSDKPLLSIIVPIYRGAAMLDDSFAQILSLEKELNARLEIIAVDDGSDDNSFAIITAWEKRHPDKFRSIRLQRNYGVMIALQAGLDCVRGDCVTFLPQDLQDSPESVAEMFAAWQAGEHINITYREGQRDEPFIKKTAAAAYHIIFKILSGVRGYPRSGFGTFLIDRRIVDLLIKHPRRHVDLLTRVFAMGGARLHAARRLPPKAKTNWTFAKNIKLVIDNLIGFSYLPVRLMSFLGILVALASFCFASYIFIGKVSGWYVIDQPPGWATIVVLLSMLLGMIMIMLGVIGEYLWRILDSVRDEPLYIIDNTKDDKDDSLPH